MVNAGDILILKTKIEIWFQLLIFIVLINISGLENLTKPSFNIFSIPTM